jgi:hypothetical protein
MKNVNFITISRNEVKFDYKNHKFLLKERKVGVYGLGYCVNLLQLEGLTKTFVKCIGWTKTDNHGGPDKDVLLPGIVTFADCKPAALKYIDALLK